MNTEKKCLVIGSNSFSGSSYINHLLNNDFTVIGCSRSKSINNVFLPYSLSLKKNNFSFFPIDINKDLPELINIIYNNEIPYIVNFAAQSMVAESWDNPSHWFNTNVMSTVNLHNELKNFKFIKKYVHISTPEVYGNCTGLVNENSSFNPSTPYAVSRAAADMSLNTYGEAYNFPYIITRAANVYGPHQQLYRIIPRTILYLLLGKKLQLHGGGSSNRSFIHIEDVCDATLKIMLKGKIKNTYHISTNEIISIKSLVENICNKLNISFEKNIDIVAERLGKDSNYSLDSSKLRKELSWDDLINLDSGIDRCIKWVTNNLSTLQKQSFKYVHKK
jgi:dTDP-glucose 4,6-dehydratase